MKRFYQRVSQPHVSSSLSSSPSQEVNSISTDQDPPSDPGLRPSISRYNPNDRDRIRRYYIENGPCQPHNHDFPLTDFGDGQLRKFNQLFYDNYKSWLEYSISKDAVFCLPCYLFRSDNLGSGGGTAWVKDGFRTWKKGRKPFEDHIGASNSRHNEAENKCRALINQSQSIGVGLGRQSVKQEMEYRTRLEASVNTVYMLLRQSWAFRGHDESESSNNKGGFLELLRWGGSLNKDIDSVILDKAPQNNKLTAPDIQRDITNAWAEETTKEILEELGDGQFSVLVDEARDAATKEQMAVVLRYVNKRGCVVERFLGIVHVSETTAATLKLALEDIFGKYDLSFARLRGQGYDGASNMSGEFNGLKALILRENNSAHYVHCFAHQLQLTLVAVASKHHEVGLFFQNIDGILNVVGGSTKRRDQLREKQRLEVIEGISVGRVVVGRGLNQETGIARAGTTRWSSHLATLNSIIILFNPTLDLLDELIDEGGTKWSSQCYGFRHVMQRFEFVFLLHFMRKSLLITHVLSQLLQKKDQDIVNAMRQVKIAKTRLQIMRDSGWDELFQEVSEFCDQHSVAIPNMEDIYCVNPRRPTNITHSHHYRVNLFYSVIDMQVGELNDRFTELNSDLLMCMSCLDPKNNFSSFNKERLLHLAQLYPDDFSEFELPILGSQLENYIMDVQDDRGFLELNTLGELSQKLVETNRHNVYPLVYKLVKLTLILPVATASVERAFSAMNYVKNELRTSMGDKWMNDCLVCYIERDFFISVNQERVVQRFQNMKSRRGKLSDLT